MILLRHTSYDMQDVFERLKTETTIDQVRRIELVDTPEVDIIIIVY